MSDPGTAVAVLDATVNLGVVHGDGPAELVRRATEAADVLAKVIEDKDLKAAWDQTTASLMEGATLKPLVVINGKPDGLFLPNHLAVEGFYLLRARTQLREITNILAK